MLYNRRPRYRERLSQVAGRHWRACEALEYDHPYGVPEQGEDAQGSAKVCGVGVGFGHLSYCHAGLTHLASMIETAINRSAAMES